MHIPQQQEHTPTWLAVRQRLRGKLGEECFGRWFESVTGSVEEAENGAVVLRLNVPSKFHRNWIDDHYSVHVQALWQSLAPGGQVLFVVEEKQSEPDTKQKALSKIIQFPLFPEETRPVTNDIARSALFSCVQGKDRQMLEKVLLATVDGVEIRFTGRQFNQDDHDLLMQLVFMGKHKPLGDYVEIPARVILKGLGRKTSGQEYMRLRDDIERLVAGTVNLSNDKIEYIGHLIDKAAQDKASRYWVYKFNPDLRALYGPSMYTLVEWEQRQNLRGKDIARWLHLYLATHAAPFPVKVATLKELSGSRAKELKNFRAKLRLALDDLEANGDIEAWEIDDNDLVHVKRGKAITDSQRRHLTRPKASRRHKN